MQKKKKEKKKGEKENKKQNKKMNGHGKHGEKKGKIGGVLNYQQIPLPCLRNKTKVRQKINENNRQKCKKPKGKQKLGWPVHILDQRTPGLGKNGGTLTGPRRSHGTSGLTSQFVPNMLFSIWGH